MQRYGTAKPRIGTVAPGRRGIIGGAMGGAQKKDEKRSRSPAAAKPPRGYGY